MLKIRVINCERDNEFSIHNLAPESMFNCECPIGRSINNGLALDSDSVSRYHGSFVFVEDKYWYSDKGSSNGSWLNKEPLEIGQHYALREGYFIEVGNYLLIVESIELPTAGLTTTTINPELDRSSSWSGGELLCIEEIYHNEDVKSLWFISSGQPTLFNFLPGQFVVIEVEILGKKVERCYSISSSPTKHHYLELTIKRVLAPKNEPNVQPGLVSNYLLNRVNIGSLFKVKGPFGTFTLKSTAKKLLFLSAGSGLTPLLSMSRYLYTNKEKSDIDLILMHSVRGINDLIFKHELEYMVSNWSKFHFHLAITNTNDTPGELWPNYTYRGRINQHKIADIVNDLTERVIYCCGTTSFTNSMKKMLEQLNFPMANFYTESFNESLDSPTPTKVSTSANLVKEPQTHGNQVLPSIYSPPTVVFAKSESEKEIAVSDESITILQLAKQQGIDISSSCLVGRCGCCRVLKLAGEVKYLSSPVGLNETYREAGYILSCIACPAEGRVVIDA